MVTICTTSFNINKFCVLPKMHLFDLRGSQNKQRLFLYTILTYRLWNRGRECLLRGTNWIFISDRYSFFLNLLKPTGHVMHHQFNIQQLYALPTLFMCFVFIWEQTATCAAYSINWLVFITEMKSVYSAVRTGSLNKAVCVSYLKG